MGAQLFRRERVILDENSFITLVIWEVDPAVAGSLHRYKYSFAYIVNELCLMRYDNERGKGDHKHCGESEIKTDFTTIEALINDFFNDVEKLRG